MMESRVQDRIEDLLREGVMEGVYPGAVLMVSQKGRPVMLKETGQGAVIPTAVAMAKDTIFDLASLTKPLATSLALMKLVDEEALDLDKPIQDFFSDPFPPEKQDLTSRRLLCHASGLVDWKPFYIELLKFPLKERKSRLRGWILNEPPAYEGGQGCLYSDLGFMLLEGIVEAVSGKTMDRFLESWLYRPLLLTRTFLGGSRPKPSFERRLFAATEDCPWRKKVMQGEVHDENAYALGGYSGHAGLFGTAEEVHALLDLLRVHYRGERSEFFKPETVRTFFTRQSHGQECTFALGWDTPSASNSSSGRYFSTRSVGHLGFTGTSVWMDLEKDVIVIFLTNRVHPSRNNEKIRTFRPRLHDTVMETLGFV